MRYALTILASILVATPAGGQTAVITRATNLRVGPSSKRAVIERLNQNDELQLVDTAQTNHYYEVRAADGEDGWVLARNLRITDTAPPEPTAAGEPAVVFHSCQPTGTAQSVRRQEANRKKNRITHPQPAEIAKNATIVAVLQNGDDRTRWSEDSGASIVAFVEEVKKGSKETVNCGDTALAFIDTHVAVVQNQNETHQNARMIVEVTPRWRAFMGQQKVDWSTPKLKQTLQGHWVRFTGWLFYDFEHENQAENTNPGGSGNWRATSWEIHPVTEIKICPGSPQGCD